MENNPSGDAMAEARAFKEFAARERLELPTDVVVDDEQYPLNLPPTPTATNLRRLAEIARTRGAVLLACAEVLEVFAKDKEAGRQKLRELYSRFELLASGRREQPTVGPTRMNWHGTQ